MEESSEFDVAIIGGGASGSALFYVLSKYTNAKRIALVEKNSNIGSVNSHATQNSQTLHVGDIETNYSVDKVRQVKPAALLVKGYLDRLPEKERTKISKVVQKMVIGVGVAETELIARRYESLKSLFPELEHLKGDGIWRVEPEVMRGRDQHELISALYNPRGMAVDFGALAQSFVSEVQKTESERSQVFLDTEVTSIEPYEHGYILHTREASIRTRVLVVDADAYSLGFAKRMGYGRQFSLIPIAGTFFFSPEVLRGKVYTVQDTRMPFAAVHGDPDMTLAGVTRWGPTARFLPVLESNNWMTSWSFFKYSGFHRLQTWISFVYILLDPVRFIYLARNFFYDLPWIGKYFFVPQVQKIVPSVTARELKRARGYGGMRLQRVDTTTSEILLGEGKIIGHKIIFNMTPSPGASVCLYNAMRDAEQIEKFFAGEVAFRMEEMQKDLCLSGGKPLGDDDVSLKDTYAA